MPKPAPAEIAAKPQPSHEKPAADVAVKPAAEAPKAEAAPKLRPGEIVSPSVKEPPAVSAATAAPQPASVPAAAAPQPVSAPAASAPQPASVTPAKPVAIPAPDRLEYEKLVLPKR